MSAQLTPLKKVKIIFHCQSDFIDRKTVMLHSVIESLAGEYNILLPVCIGSLIKFSKNKG